MTLYRTVPVSDRLPAKEGRYIVSNGLTWFEACYSYNYSFHEEFTDCSGIVAWLEVVELPTEDEIQYETRCYAADNFNETGWEGHNTRMKFRAGVNWLKERIGL